MILDKGSDNMKPLKEKISITLDSDLVAQLKSEAEVDDRSLSQYINLLLKNRFKAAAPSEKQTSI
jgi:hypothetical protein